MPDFDIGAEGGIVTWPPGAYGRNTRSGPTEGWYVKTPNSHAGNLGAHEVVEHEDGTITVTPSILVSWADGEELYHGYLTRGIWEP